MTLVEESTQNEYMSTVIDQIQWLTSTEKCKRLPIQCLYVVRNCFHMNIIFDVIGG